MRFAMLRFACLLTLSLFQFGCTFSSHLTEGIKSFRLQDYRQAFIRLKPEAKKGQRDAQYAVGYMYYYGQGVVENRRKAWFWINKAAKAGQPEAIAAVAILQQQPHNIFP
jgi:TPR repeat protein